MKTTNFKRALLPGLMGLAYSSKIVTDVGNNVAEEEQSIAIEDVPTFGEAASIDEP